MLSCISFNSYHKSTILFRKHLFLLKYGWRLKSVLTFLSKTNKKRQQDFINLNKAGSAAFGQYIDWQVDEIQGKKLFSLMQTGNWSQFEFAAPIMDGHANSITIDSRLNNNFFQCRSRALALALVSCYQYYYCWPKCSKFYTRKNLVKLPQSNEI